MAHGNRLLPLWSMFNAAKFRVWAKTNKTTTCWELWSIGVMQPSVWEDASPPPPPFGGTPTVMPKHVLCARFCFQKRLVINFSRGIASIVDCYLSYFICVDVYASACLSFFYLVCCSTDEMFWIISRIETKKKKKSYQVPCSLYSIVPSCPWLGVRVFFLSVSMPPYLF